MPSAPHGVGSGVQRLLARLMLGAAALYGLAGAGLASHARLPQAAALWGGALLLVAGALWRRRRAPGPSLALLLLGAGLPGLLAAFLPGAAAIPIELWRPDPRFGVDHRAALSRPHLHPKGDFDVRYTIAADGCRQLAQPPNPRGRVLFLGGSYTFGWGVADDQPFVSLLAAAWPELAVRNRSVAGWGTGHAWLALQDALASGPPPDVVVYVMIPHHIQRNACRASWLDFLRRVALEGGVAPRGHPRFALVDDQPVYTGLAFHGEPDSPALDAQERALTGALLTAMQTACQQAGSQWLLVLLPEPAARYPENFVPECRARGLRLVELQGLSLDCFPHDNHPNAEDHRRIAAALQASELGQLLRALGE